MNPKKPFDFYTEILNDSFTVDKHYCRSALLETMQEYWTEAVRLSDDDKFRMAQIHTMTIISYVQNIQHQARKDAIMARLRQEYADKLNRTVDSLYLHYPHNEVAKEYPVEIQYWGEFIAQDMEVLNRANNLAFGADLHRNVYHIESMVGYMEMLRIRMIRNYIEII